MNIKVTRKKLFSNTNDWIFLELQAWCCYRNECNNTSKCIISNLLSFGSLENEK